MAASHEPSGPSVKTIAPPARIGFDAVLVPLSMQRDWQESLDLWFQITLPCSALIAFSGYLVHRYRFGQGTASLNTVPVWF